MGKYNADSVGGSLQLRPISFFCKETPTSFRMWYFSIIFFSVIFFSSACAEEINCIWFEAEDAVSHTFPKSNAFAVNTPEEKDVLSGGEWLQTDKGSGAAARWEVDVPDVGEYEFWGRMFWKHGPFKWQWNGGEWKTCGKDRVLADGVTIRTHLGANWVPLGKVTLPAGKNILEIKALPEAKAIALDCWMLSIKPFTPNGKMKPGEKYNRAPEGWFPFEPDPEHWGDAGLDIGKLMNEPEAGSKGRIVKQGKDLVHSKTGEQIRFWSVVAGAEIALSGHKAIDHLANRLSKYGVNLVRWHIPGKQETQPGPVTDGLQYAVNALKNKGIYSYVLWYCTACQGEHTNLFYFSKKHQQMHKDWATCMLGTKSPYTGKTLAEDEALAAVELLDEDSILFWTFKPDNNRLKPYISELENSFISWLIEKYGSLENADKAWGGEKYPEGDDFTSGRIGFYSAGHLGSFDWAVSQRNQKRARDQAEFFTLLMRDFYGGMKTWMREELGFEGLVIGSNWKTADERVLMPLDQYANLSADVLARNTYFGGEHKGEGKGYSVRKGHIYTDKSMLKNPEQAILMHAQIADHPYIMTEGSFTAPNRFRAEEPLAISAYYSLQGMDGYCAFAIERDWLKAMDRKWPLHTPAAVGQYPAASLLYRKGYIKEGPVVINDVLNLEDLYNLKGASVSTPLGLDDFQAVHVPEGMEGSVDSLPGIDPLAFFTGRVLRTITDKPAKSMFLNISKLINRAEKKVTSATGELVLDYGNGLLTINAPCARGAGGFLKQAGTINLKDVSITSENEIAYIAAVSLDGKPLKESEKILLQVMTEERNFGWKTKPVKTSFSKNGPEVDALEITDIGAPPICVKNIEGTVSFRRPDAVSLNVTTLDFNGYEKTRVGTAEKIILEPDVLYYLIRK